MQETPGKNSHENKFQNHIKELNQHVLGINQELKELKSSAAAAKKQADQMEKKLQTTASRIEKKFFVRKGQKLGK